MSTDPASDDAGAPPPRQTHRGRLTALRQWLAGVAQSPPSSVAADAVVAAAAAADAGTDRTADHWGRDARARQSELNAYRYWSSHPVTAREINRRVSGDPDIGWMAHLKQHHFAQPARRAISLGSGSGAVVIDAVLSGVAERMTGIDISPEAVAVARERALAQGLDGRVDFRVENLNTLRLTGPLDLIVFEQSLHHVDAIDALLDQCREALAPEGRLVLIEYVGADRFQWSDEAQRLMNAVLALLPRRLRIDPLSGLEKGGMLRPTVEQVVAVDPSEAIHSSRIMPACNARFGLVECRDFGGALLQFMLADIVAAFDPDNDAEVALLRLMALFEEELERAGAIASDFVFAVYRHRP